MYEVIADGVVRWRHTELPEATRVAKLLIKKSITLRVAIWPLPRHHTHPTKVYFHDRYFLMTTATKTVYPVITYRNPDAPHDIQVQRTPYEPPDGVVTWLVTQPNDLLHVPTPVLLHVYNMLTGKKTTQFNTKAKGALQVYKALTEQQQPPSTEPPSAPVTTPSEDSPMPVTAKKTKRTATKKASRPVTNKKAAASGSGRPSRFQLTDTIVDIIENPKRPGSAAHARYNLYRPGQTVADFLKKGGWRADINWDVKQGFIKIKREK